MAMKWFSLMLVVPLLAVTTPAFAQSIPGHGTAKVGSVSSGQSSSTVSAHDIAISDQKTAALLENPSVQRALSMRIDTLPTLKMSPGQTRVDVYHIDGITLVYTAHDTPVPTTSGNDPVNAVSASLVARGLLNQWVWTAKYSDTYKYNYSTVNAAYPTWSFSHAAYVFFTTFSPYNSHIDFQNSSMVESTGSANVSLQITRFGTIQSTYLSSQADMYSSGYATASIS